MKRPRTLAKKERKALQSDAKLAKEVINAVKPKPKAGKVIRVRAQAQVGPPRQACKDAAIDDLLNYENLATTDDRVDALGFGYAAAVDYAQDIKRRLRRRRT